MTTTPPPPTTTPRVCVSSLDATPTAARAARTGWDGRDVRGAERNAAPARLETHERGARPIGDVRLARAHPFLLERVEDVVARVLV